MKAVAWCDQCGRGMQTTVTRSVDAVLRSVEFGGGFPFDLFFFLGGGVVLVGVLEIQGNSGWRTFVVFSRRFGEVTVEDLLSFSSFIVSFIWGDLLRL